MPWRVFRQTNTARRLLQGRQSRAQGHVESNPSWSIRTGQIPHILVCKCLESRQSRVLTHCGHLNSDQKRIG